MVFSAVYGCPFVREGPSGGNATYQDFQNLVKLAQSFPELDSPGGTICEPDDKPLDSRHLDMVYALMTLSDKPFMGSVTSAANARRHDRDGGDRVRRATRSSETPAIISLINVNSPLRFDDRMLGALIEYAKRGQPTIVTPFLLMGAMSPVSVAATLAQQVGEALAGIALVPDDPARLPGRVRVVPLEHRHAVRVAVHSERRSPPSGCSARARSRATTTCRSAAAAR